MEGQPALPRKNCDLVFEEPCMPRLRHGRALHERGLYAWEGSAQPQRPDAAAGRAPPHSSTTRSAPDLEPSSPSCSSSPIPSSRDDSSSNSLRDEVYYSRGACAPLPTSSRAERRSSLPPQVNNMTSG